MTSDKKPVKEHQKKPCRLNSHLLLCSPYTLLSSMSYNTLICLFIRCFILFESVEIEDTKECCFYFTPLHLRTVPHFHIYTEVCPTTELRPILNDIAEESRMRLKEKSGKQSGKRL